MNYEDIKKMSDADLIKLNENLSNKLAFVFHNLNEKKYCLMSAVLTFNELKKRGYERRHSEVLKMAVWAK